MRKRLCAPLLLSQPRAVLRLIDDNLRTHRTLAGGMDVDGGYASNLPVGAMLSDLSRPSMAGAARTIVIDERLGREHIAAAVEATEGLSGREISKLAIAWQAAAYGKPDVTFTPELMADVLETHAAQRTIMKSWTSDS